MSFSAGTFSINSAGQPVVTGTTISATVFNAFTSDIATGLSTCMLKDGTQTATAGIGFFAGTVSLPGIYFGTDTATGFYRIGLNNTGFSVNGTKLIDLSAALFAVPAVSVFGAANAYSANSRVFINGGTSSSTPLIMLSDTAGRVLKVGTSDFVSTSTGSLLSLSFGAGTGDTTASLTLSTAGGTTFTTTLTIGATGNPIQIGGAFGVTGASTLTGALIGDATTDSTSTTTGAFQTDGGLGVAKALWVGGLANIAGAATLQSTLAVSGQITAGGAAVASPIVRIEGTDATNKSIHFYSAGAYKGGIRLGATAGFALTLDVAGAGGDSISIAQTGVITIPNLAGAGTRNVVASATGVLSAP